MVSTRLRATPYKGTLEALCDTDGISTRKVEAANVKRIETTVTVGDDGVSATIALPVPVTPGRHPAVVIIDDGAEIDDAAAWAARTYGSVTDETFERPEALPLEERKASVTPEHRPRCSARPES
jgi:hypothetical protein